VVYFQCLNQLTHCMNTSYCFQEKDSAHKSADRHRFGGPKHSDQHQTIALVTHPLETELSVPCPDSAHLNISVQTYLQLTCDKTSSSPFFLKVLNRDMSLCSILFNYNRVPIASPKIILCILLVSIQKKNAIRSN
jgi:hypothetical protein